jgi:hypothetical protein
MSFLFPRSSKDQRKLVFHCQLVKCDNLPVKSGKSVFVKWRRGSHQVSGHTPAAPVDSVGSVVWPSAPFAVKATIQPKTPKKISFSVRQVRVDVVLIMLSRGAGGVVLVMMMMMMKTVVVRSVLNG